MRNSQFYSFVFFFHSIRHLLSLVKTWTLILTFECAFTVFSRCAVWFRIIGAEKNAKLIVDLSSACERNIRLELFWVSNLNFQFEKFELNEFCQTKTVFLGSYRPWSEFQQFSHCFRFISSGLSTFTIFFSFPLAPFRPHRVKRVDCFFLRLQGKLFISPSINWAHLTSNESG